MLNYTVRAVYWKHKPNRQELCPIKIAVTINRKVTYIKTPFKVKGDHWNEEKKEVWHCSNAMNINALLRKQIAELEGAITTKQLEGQVVTKKLLKGNAHRDKTFKAFAKEVRYDGREVNRLETYHEGLTLQEVDIAFLRRYERHERSRGMAPNTLNTTFKYLRRIINQAKSEGLVKDNPFDSYGIPRYQQTDRVYLVNEEREAMQKLLKKETGELYTTLCYFLLGCYSGLRHSDWLLFDPVKMVHGGFLRLRAKKNKQFVVLPIGPTLEGIINRIRELGKPLSNQKCNVHLKALGGMAELKKAVTTHTGRHSFGYLCANNRLPKSVTAELMGISTQTVEVYYHLSGQDIADQAAILKLI